MTKQEIEVHIPWELNEGYEPGRTGANDKARNQQQGLELDGTEEPLKH